MDCCAVQESEKSLDEKTTGLAASLPGFDCCALQDLAAQETSQPKHIVPDVTVFVPVMAAFFPPQIITSEPYFPSLSLPDKSNLRMLNCVWRI